MEYLFPFNGMFVLYLETFCPKKIMMEFKTLKTDVVFFFDFVINSKRQSRNMIFWKRTCKIEMMMNPKL